MNTHPQKEIITKRVTYLLADFGDRYLEEPPN